MLFRAQNKFELEGFLEKKYKGLVALIKMRPVESLQEIISRMLDSECSVGEKLILIECLSNSAVEMANIEVQKNLMINNQ